MTLPILKVILLTSAYLIGSIPSAVWISKLFYNTDIRLHGSGNAGTTNMIRIFGLWAGLPVFLIDMLKGYFAVKLIFIAMRYYAYGSTDYVTFELFLGIAAVAGHIFPILAKFKGGKGVATLMGIILAIDPIPVLICVGIFALCLFITRYVSLSSIVAGIAFPILIIFIFKTSVQSLIVFSLFTTIVILLTHQKNIERLIRREESKANLFRKRRKD